MTFRPLRNILDDLLSRTLFLHVVNRIKRILGLPPSSWFEAYYRRWIKAHTPGPADLDRMASRAKH